MSVASERSDSASRQKQAPRRVPFGPIARWLFVAAGALLMAFPLYWMFVTSVSSTAELRSGNYGIIPDGLLWEGYARIFEQLPFVRWYLNSILITVAGVVLTVTINLVCGYAFSKLRFPGVGCSWC